MKNTFLTAAIILGLFAPKVRAQTFYRQSTNELPASHFVSDRQAKPATLDSAFIYIDYSAADQSLFSGNYMSQQGQLLNKYYKYPADTSNAFNTKNYACINSIAVAFDSLYAINYGMGFPSYAVTNLWLDTLYVPVVQLNHSGKNDTLEIQVNTVDAAGYPTTSTIFDTLIIADSANHYNIGNGNNYSIKTIKWNLGYYPIAGSKFAVTMKYSDPSKLDSCWFIYGYGYFNKTCPYQKGNTTFADNTHFSKIKETKPFVANSFALWNEYKGSGMFPTTLADNVFYPCDSTDFVFKPGIDGATYFQNINITVCAAMEFVAGMPTIHSNSITISQNYPNPFNKSSVINYTLSKSAEVTLQIVDLTGRQVFDQNYGATGAGTHSITLNAATLSPGIYFYSITATGSTVTKKMVVY